MRVERRGGGRGRGVKIDVFRHQDVIHGGDDFFHAVDGRGSAVAVGVKIDDAFNEAVVDAVEYSATGCG